MTRSTWIAVALAALRSILRAYPNSFRARFGADTLATARETLEDAARDGHGQLARVVAIELSQGVTGIMPEHRRERHRHRLLTRSEALMLLFQSLATEARHAIRSLAKAPGFTLVALAVLTMGIGASTAIYSVVDAVVLRGLPFDEHDRLVAVLEHDPARPTTFGGGATTTQTFLDWRARQQVFEGITAVSSTTFRIRSQAGEPAEARGRRISMEFFTVLRVAPALGRPFASADEIEARPVAVLSHQFWQRQFGGAPDVLGKSIQLDDVVHEVVGVMPQGFSYPVGSQQAAEVFVPLAFTGAERQRGSSRNYNYLTIGRLKDGMTVAAANAQVASLTDALAVEFPAWYGKRTGRVIPLYERMVSADVRRWMLLLLGAVTLVLLIACANVANLLLARAAARGRETGIRAALGAGRLRLIRELLIESLVLSAAGTALGVLAGSAGIRMLKAVLPAGLPRVADIGLDWRVLTAASLAALITGVLFGIVPAILASRPNLTQSLREGGRSSTASLARRRFRSALVVAEIALAAVLVIGAGLFVTSFVKLMRIDPGFDYRGLLTPGQVNADFDRKDFDGSLARGGRQAREVLDVLAAVPGVVAVEGVSGGLPFTGSWNRTSLTLPGRGQLTGDDNDADIRLVSDGYLQLLGLPLRAGRFLSKSDTESSEPVLVVNEAAAQWYWPGQDPVGQRVKVNDGDRVVVGVVGNLRHLGPEEPVRKEVYLPFRQNRLLGIDLVIRTAGDPMSLLPSVRAAIWRVYPEHRFAAIPQTFEGHLDALVEERRFNMTLLSLFGVLGLVIAAVGIYGVMAYVVSQRTVEFGVRMALGATKGRLVRMVVGQASALVAVGVVSGAAAAWWLSRLTASFLFELDPRDTRVFAGSLAVLALTAMAASVVPARRAAKVDPLVAMKE